MEATQVVTRKMKIELVLVLQLYDIKGLNFFFLFSYFCLSFSSSSFVEVGEVIYFEASLEG